MPSIFGKHVIAAPIIKKHGLEAISTGYILVESGRVTTAQYISGSVPVPRHKPEIAVATALAAEYLGMKFYLFGSGLGCPISHVPV
jgi:Predicted phosphate-binding enzymes, TIM-barrel fold